MTDDVYCKNKKRRKNLDTYSLSSLEKAITSVEPDKVDHYLSDKPKNEKIDLLKNLANRKYKEIIELKKN